MGKDRRSYRQWSCEETVALHRGVERYNKRWISILTDPELAQVLSGRAAVQLKDKWRNIQKCEKRRKVPRREASQPCVSSVTPAPAGSARLPFAAVLDLLPEDGHLEQRRSRRFTAAPRKRYAESDSASGEEDADDEDFQCKYQDEEPEGSTAGEEEQTVSESTHAHRVTRVSALAGSHTAAQSPGLSLPQPVSVSKRRIVTARAGSSLGPAGTQPGLPGVAMIDTLDSGDSEQSVILGGLLAAPGQQEGPAALCMPPQGIPQEIPLQAPQLQHPQYSAELLQALMRSHGALRQQGLHLEARCGALPVHHLQHQQSQQQHLWRDQGGAGTVMALGLEALQGLEDAAMGCAPPARCLPQQALNFVCLLPPGLRPGNCPRPTSSFAHSRHSSLPVAMCVLAEARLRCLVLCQRCCRGACRATSFCLRCFVFPEP